MEYKIGDEVTLNRPFYLSGTGVTILIGTVGIVREVGEDELTVEFPSYKRSVKLYPGEVTPIRK